MKNNLKSTEFKSSLTSLYFLNNFVPIDEDNCIYYQSITARIQRMMEGNVFTLSTTGGGEGRGTSSCPMWGGRVPHPARLGRGGGTHLRRVSHTAQWGHPIQLNGGYPHLRTGVGYPPPSGWMGYPLPGRQSSTASTC